MGELREESIQKQRLEVHNSVADDTSNSCEGGQARTAKLDAIGS